MGGMDNNMLERLTMAADYDSARQEASKRFYDALAQFADSDVVAELEEAFNDAWIAAAYAVAAGWSAPAGTELGARN